MDEADVGLAVSKESVVVVERKQGKAAIDDATDGLSIRMTCEFSRVCCGFPG